MRRLQRNRGEARNGGSTTLTILLRAAPAGAASARSLPAASVNEWRSSWSGARPAVLAR